MSQLKQTGFREPSGQMHSKWGEEANIVEQAVSKTVNVENNRLPWVRITVVYQGNTRRTNANCDFASRSPNIARGGIAVHGD